MWAIIAKGIWENRIKLIIVILLCAVFIWMYAGFYPSIQGQADDFNKMLESYPEGFMEAFGLNDQNMFANFETFLAIEYFSMVWPIILIILIITYASSAIAGEIEQGTIEVLLAQPISRTKLFLAKYFSGLMMIALCIIFTVFPASLIAQAYNIEMSLSNLYMLAILGLLFGWAIHSLTFMFSSIFSTRGNPTFIIAGIMIIMYVLNILASIKESAESMKYFSYFYYFDYSKAIIDSQINAVSLWVFIGSIILFSLIGWIYFLKRDIPV